jgi:hypothetical protein
MTTRRRKNARFNRNYKIHYSELSKSSFSQKNRKTWPKIRTGQAKSTAVRVSPKSGNRQKPIASNSFIDYSLYNKNTLPPCQRERQRVRRDYLSFRNSSPPRLKSGGSGHSNRFTMRKCK